MIQPELVNCDTTASSDALWRMIFECSPDCILIVDSRGKIARASASVEKMFGYGREELIGEPLEILIPERFRDNHIGLYRQSMDHASAGRMNSSLETPGRRKDRSEFPAEIRLVLRPALRVIRWCLRWCGTLRSGSNWKPQSDFWLPSTMRFLIPYSSRMISTAGCC